MSGAANNPYKQEAPDKTLTQEGVAADAKAVGNALIKIAKIDYRITVTGGFAYLSTSSEISKLNATKVLAIIPVITAPFVGINQPQSAMLRGNLPTPEVCIYAPNGGGGVVTAYVFYL